MLRLRARGFHSDEENISGYDCSVTIAVQYSCLFAGFIQVDRFDCSSFGEKFAQRVSMVSVNHSCGLTSTVILVYSGVLWCESTRYLRSVRPSLRHCVELWARRSNRAGFGAAFPCDSIVYLQRNSASVVSYCSIMNSIGKVLLAKFCRTKPDSWILSRKIYHFIKYNT